MYQHAHLRKSAISKIFSNGFQFAADVILIHISYDSVYHWVVCLLAVKIQVRIEGLQVSYQKDSAFHC